MITNHPQPPTGFKQRLLRTSKPAVIRGVAVALMALAALGVGAGATSVLAGVNPASTSVVDNGRAVAYGPPCHTRIMPDPEPQGWGCPPYYYGPKYIM
jgi:hypothetical protein